MLCYPRKANFVDDTFCERQHEKLFEPVIEPSVHISFCPYFTTFYHRHFVQKINKVRSTELFNGHAFLILLGGFLDNELCHYLIVYL